MGSACMCVLADALSSLSDGVDVPVLQLTGAEWCTCIFVSTAPLTFGQ